MGNTEKSRNISGSFWNCGGRQLSGQTVVLWGPDHFWVWDRISEASTCDQINSRCDQGLEMNTGLKHL